MIAIEERKDCVVIKLKISNRAIERRIPWIVLNHVYKGRLKERVEELIEYARQNERDGDFQGRSSYRSLGC